MIIGPKTGSKSSILTNQLVNSDQGIGPHAQLSGGNGNSRQGSWRLPIISLDTESDSGHVRFGFEGLAKPGRVMSKAYQSIAQGFHPVTRHFHDDVRCPDARGGAGIARSSLLHGFLAACSRVRPL